MRQRSRPGLRRAITTSVITEALPQNEIMPGFIDCTRATAGLYSIIAFGRKTGPLRFALVGRTFSLSPNSTKLGTGHDFHAPAHVCTPSVKGLNQMTNGTVKFYNDQKGFGFIQPEDGGKDVFVHATALERAGIGALREGQKVAFDTQTDSRSGKTAVGRIELR